MNRDAIRRLLDPRGQGVPRRAALDAAGLVVAAAPGTPEVDVVSDVCHAVFGDELESRDAAVLVQRAFVSNVPAAWRALRDDCLANRVPDHVLGTISPDRILAAIMEGGEDPIVVCAHLFSRIDVPVDVPDGTWCDVARALAAAVPDDDADAGRAVMQHLDPSTNRVGAILLEAPDVATLFVGGCFNVPSALRCEPAAIGALAAHAATLEAHRRYAPLAVLAMASAAGVRGVDPGIGVATLVDLRRRAFDAKVAAAAAVVAQGHADAAIRGMARVVESLAAAVQRR